MAQTFHVSGEQPFWHEGQFGKKCLWPVLAPALGALARSAYSSYSPSQWAYVACKAAPLQDASAALPKLLSMGWVRGSIFWGGKRPPSAPTDLGLSCGPLYEPMGCMLLVILFIQIQAYSDFLRVRLNLFQLHKIALSADCFCNLSSEHSATLLHQLTKSDHNWENCRIQLMKHTASLPGGGGEPLKTVQRRKETVLRRHQVPTKKVLRNQKKRTQNTLKVLQLCLILNTNLQWEVMLPS